MSDAASLAGAIPARPRRDERLGRVLHASLAALALVMVLPLLGAIALAIRLEGPGPILFRQTRHGKDKVPFRILKFRTMTVCEDGDAFRQARRRDPRVTRVGSFLRRTSLDELPQLVNVLRGEMSLVGPRPHATSHDGAFAERIPFYERRFEVLPGITGLAQIRGYRGPTETDEEMRVRLASDLEYIERRGILLDLKIMLMTVVAVVSGRNAF